MQLMVLKTALKVVGSILMRVSSFLKNTLNRKIEVLQVSPPGVSERSIWSVMEPRTVSSGKFTETRQIVSVFQALCVQTQVPILKISV